MKAYLFSMLRWRPLLWGLASMIAGFTLAEVFGNRLSFPDEEQRKLKQTALLLVQQVDRLAANYLETLPSGSLPEREREALRIWRLFDKQFVELNESDSIKSFEVATALRRIGFASLLLQEKQQAREYLERANRHFAELENQFPSAISYRLDHAATLLQLAQLEQLENNSQAAIAQCQNAIAILQLENTLDNGDFDLGVSKLVHSASQILMSLGKSELARQLSSRNITILQRLDDRQVNQSLKAKLIDQSREIIQSANHGI